MTQDQVFASRPDSFVTWAKHFAFYKEDSKRIEPKRIEFFKAIRSEEMDAMVQGLQSKVKDGKHVVDLHLAIGAMAMNIMTRMVMKKRLVFF